MNKVDESDSSNDEETYQDYFTNPQKRKQFDNQRLYQQQKELQKMSGFNKQIVIEPPKRITEQDNQRNYATVSLFCLTVTNPFRDKMIRIVLNQWFDRFILFTIIVNCVFLAIDDPNLDQLDYQILADYIFLVIFTTEMCLKVVAMGFALRPYSYLRDAWNILDFIVVIMGWVSKVVTANNVSAIRVIRILRPLRTINSMPGMRRLVQSLLNSLPTLFDILVLFSFFLVMFGTIATQLFGGLLQNRCVDEEGNVQKGHDGNDYFCKIDDSCPGAWVCRYIGNPDYEVTSFDNILKSVLNIFIIITLEGWTDTMYKIRSATGTVGYDIVFILIVVFGAFFILNLMVAVQFSYLNAQFQEQSQRNLIEKMKQNAVLQKMQDETPNSPQKHVAEIQENSAKFNEGFSHALEVVKGIESSSAVQIIEKNKSDQNSPQQEILENNQFDSLSQQQIQDMLPKQQNSNVANQNSLKLSEEKAQKEKTTAKQKYKKLKRLTFELVESKPFNITIIVLIMINTIFMAMEHYNMPDKLTDAVNYGNSTLTCIFACEMVLKIMGLGIKKYAQDGFNGFDAIIVIVGLLEFVNAGSKVLTVLRAFRLLRIFKIVKSWTTLKKLLQTVLSSFSSIANLGLLMFLLIFIYSLIGMQFFSGPIPDNEDNSFRFNFNSFAYSLITIFVMLTAENWNSILIQFIDKDGFGASVYFVSLIIFGNIMVLNLFLAILLSFISENFEETEHKDSDDAHDTSLQNKNEEIVEEQFDYIQERLRIKAGIKVGVSEASKNNGEAYSSNPNSNSLSIKNGLNNTLGLNNTNQQADKNSSKNSVNQQQQDVGTIRVEDVSVNFNNIENSNGRLEGELHGVTERSNEESKNNRRSVVNRNRSRTLANNQRSSNFELAEENQNGDATGKSAQQRQEDMTISEFQKSQKIEDGSDMQIKRLVTSRGSVISAMKNSIKKQFKTKGNNVIMNIRGRSLFIFSQDSKVRRFLKATLSHPYFENFIYHLIGLNSLILAMDEPQLSDDYQLNTLSLLVTIISAIFIVEAVAKIIVLGFAMGKDAYLKDPWNILDFVIVSFSIFNWVIDSFSNVSVSFLRGFRALRALRPLRMVSKNEGMKIVVNSLLTSIPNLFNVMLISLLFYLVFGILGVQLFKGSLGACNDQTIDYKYNCVGIYQNDDGHWVGRQWNVPFNNFDNIFYSMCTFFEIATLENWPATLFAAIDSQDIDFGPKLDNRPYVALLFIVFIFITTFFVMNLFISVIVDKFNEEIKKKEGSHKFSEEQKEWVKMQRIMVHVNLKIKPVCPEQNKLRKVFFITVMSKHFELFISFVITINTLFLCMDYYGADKSYSNALQTGNIIFVSIFAVEASMKMIAHGVRFYFLETWNKFDFVIVILSLVALDESIFSFKVNALRIIRVARLLRMIKASKGLRHLLKTLWLSMGNIANVGMLLFLIFFTFTVAGMDLFGNLSQSEYITKNANFQSFYITIILLFRASTGENWNGIMHDCFDQEGLLAIIYWIAFQLVTHYIFLNVFIAVIYENFNDVKASEDENEVLSLKRKDIKAFIKTWALFCPNGEHYLKTTEFSNFLKQLPPPLGYEGQKIEQAKLNKIIFCLNIKSHLRDGEGKVYFPEVMWAIFHSIIGNNDEQVHNCEQVVNIMKELKRKYKGLGKHVTPDSLCGNKYYRTEMTVSKYMCALQIYKNWKRYQGQRQKKKDLIAQQQKEQAENELKNSSLKENDLQEENSGVLRQGSLSDNQMRVSDNSESILLQHDNNNNVHSLRLKLQSSGFESALSNTNINQNQLDSDNLKKTRTLGQEEQKMQQRDEYISNLTNLPLGLQIFKSNQQISPDQRNGLQEQQSSGSLSSQSNNLQQFSDDSPERKLILQKTTAGDKLALQLASANDNLLGVNHLAPNIIDDRNYLRSFGVDPNQFVSQAPLENHINPNDDEDSFHTEEFSEEFSDEHSAAKDKYFKNPDDGDGDENGNSQPKKQVMLDFALIKGNMNLNDFLQKDVKDFKSIKEDKVNESYESEESQQTVKNQQNLQDVRDKNILSKAKAIRNQQVEQSNKSKDKRKSKKNN